MRQPCAKPIARTLLSVTGISLAVLLVVSCSSRSSYFAVVEGPLEMQAGDPVLINSVVGGSIREIAVDPGRDRKILEVSIAREYSLPAGSQIEVISGPGLNGSLEISLVASRDYFQAGDTIYRGPATVINVPPAPGSGDPNISHPFPVYKIQVFASGKRIATSAAFFEGLGNVEEREEDGLFKYYSGVFERHAEAEEYRKKVAGSGIEDAFVVCFLDGKRISVEEARQLEK